MCGRFTQLHLPMSILNLLGLSEIQIEDMMLLYNHFVSSQENLKEN
jgi:hypothetical protein